MSEDSPETGPSDDQPANTGTPGTDPAGDAFSGASPWENYSPGTDHVGDAFSGAVPWENYTPGTDLAGGAFSGAVAWENYTPGPASAGSATNPAASETPPDQESTLLRFDIETRMLPAPSGPPANVNAVNPWTGGQPSDSFTGRPPADPFRPDQDPGATPLQPGSTFLDPGRYAGVFLNDLYAAPETAAQAATAAATQSPIPRSDPGEGPQLWNNEWWVQATESASSPFGPPKQNELFLGTIRGPVLGAALPGVATTIGAAALTEGTANLAAGDYQAAQAAFGTALEVLPAVSPEYLLSADQRMTMAIRESMILTERESLQVTLRQSRAREGYAQRLRGSGDPVFSELKKQLLNDAGKFKSTVGKKHIELIDNPDLLEMMHLASDKAGGDRVAVGLAWINQFDRLTVEGLNNVAFMFIKNEAVLIGGIPFETRSALWWESLGWLPKGTVARAPRIVP